MSHVNSEQLQMVIRAKREWYNEWKTPQGKEKKTWNQRKYQGCTHYNNYA